MNLSNQNNHNNEKSQEQKEDSSEKSFYSCSIPFLSLILIVLIFMAYMIFDILRTTDLISRLSVGMLESDIQERLRKPDYVFYKSDYEEALKSVSNPYTNKGDLKLPINYKVNVYNIHCLFVGNRLYIFINSENKVSCIFMENFKFRPFWFKILSNRKRE